MLFENLNSFESLTSRFRFSHVHAETTVSRGSPEQKDRDDFGEGVNKDGRAVLDEFQGQIGDTVTTFVSAIDESVSPFD